MKVVLYGATGKGLADQIVKAVATQIEKVGLETYPSREEELADRDEKAVAYAEANFGGVAEYTVTVEVAE